MRPDSTVVINGHSGKSYALVQPGKQYASYFYQNPGCSFELKIPPGTYEVEWMNPVTGAPGQKKLLKHAGGKFVLAPPAYPEDIALRIVKSGGRD